MIELWLLRGAVVVLYVGGSTVVWAWVQNEGRLRGRYAAFWIALWPIFAWAGLIVGTFLWLRDGWRRG